MLQKRPAPFQLRPQVASAETRGLSMQLKHHIGTELFEVQKDSWDFFPFHCYVNEDIQQRAGKGGAKRDTFKCCVGARS